MAWVRPLAPSAERIWPETGSIATDSTIITSAISTRLEVASRRALCRSPAPSARETRAVPAMEKPMPKEVRKNSTVPA